MPRRQTRRRLVTALALLAPLAAFAADIPAAQRRSGYEFMGRETRAIEDDDTGNPGMLAVLARCCGTAAKGRPANLAPAVTATCAEA